MTDRHPLWLPSDPLVLASGSAARRLLLEGAGIPVEVRPAAIDERSMEQPLIERGCDGEAVALHLGRAKALAVSAERPGRLVLGADQTLSCGGRLFHKPADRAAAAAQIGALAGRTHALNAAAVLVRDGAVLFETVAVARLTMRALSPAFLELYLAAAGPGVSGSVGGYQLEGAGIHLFDRVEGDQSTVMGLPLLRLLAALRALGVLAS